MSTAEKPSSVTGVDQHEVDAVVARIRAGLPLDERYKSVLFTAGREAELNYAGKETRGSVLAGVMAVPLQVQKVFGATKADWTDKLVFGDNLQVLRTLLDLKERGALRNADGTQGVRLCYIDPPFATKREFRGRRGALAYRDKVEGAQFVEYLRRRIILIHELLADDGALYLHLDTNKVHYMKVALDEIFGANNLLAGSYGSDHPATVMPSGGHLFTRQSSPTSRPASGLFGMPRASHKILNMSPPSMCSTTMTVGGSTE